MEKKSTHLIKGLLISLVLIILSLIQFILKDYSNNSIFSWLSPLLLFIGIIYSCLSYAKEENFNIKFGKIFGYGFKTVALITIIIIIYQIIFVYLIYPGLKDKIIENTIIDMTKKNLTSEQIDQSVAFIKRLFMPFMFAGIIFGNLFIGCIASLIGAGFAKKNPVSPFDEFVDTKVENPQESENTEKI